MVKWQYASVDLSTDTTTVSASSVWFLGVIVTTTMSVHDCEIKDGTTVVLTIPSGSTVGATYSLEGVVFNTSLVVDPHNDATGRITVIYRASA